MAHIASRLRSDSNRAQGVLVFELHHGGDRNVDCIELIVSCRGLDHPSIAPDHANDGEAFAQQRYLLASRIGGAEEFLTYILSQDDDIASPGLCPAHLELA